MIVSLAAADPANLSANPPRLIPGAGPALPIGERKVGELTSPAVNSGQPIDLYPDNFGNRGAPFTPVGGGGGAGKATFSDLSVIKGLDRSSPDLLRQLKAGTHHPSVEIKLLQPGTTKVFSRYTLSDAVVSSYQLASGASALEQISFGYTRIRQRIPQPGGGELDTCWDVALNGAC